MLKFLVGGGGGYEQTVSVANGEAADETSAGNRAVDDRDDIRELGLKGGVEVGTAADSDKAVGVGETSKDADLGRVFKLATDGHDDRATVLVRVLKSSW